MLPIADYAGLRQEQLGFMERSFGHFTMLSQVLEWCRERHPAVAVDGIVTMDEYSHDVLVKLADGRYLAFDTT